MKLRLTLSLILFIVGAAQARIIDVSDEEGGGGAVPRLDSGNPSALPEPKTPGGGVPRISDELIKPQPCRDAPWWERWWDAVVAFFS